MSVVSVLEKTDHGMIERECTWQNITEKKVTLSMISTGFHWGCFFLCFPFFFFFQDYWNTDYLSNGTFIFGRLQCNLAQVTPVKCKSDLNVLTYNFAKGRQILLTESFTFGAAVTPPQFCELFLFHSVLRVVIMPTLLSLSLPALIVTMIPSGHLFTK